MSVAVTQASAGTKFQLDHSELRIDYTCGSGKGGQHRNRKKTAVRILHVPTGTIVFVCKERDREQNRRIALETMRERLEAVENEQLEEQLSDNRQDQMGGGKRSDKKRTYNFMKDYVNDHVLNRKVKGVKRVLKGRLDYLIE